jgi:putative chitinase
MTTFTLAQLLHLAPNAREAYREAFARVDVLRDAGLLEPQRLAHFLAQVCHETGGLRILVENLHYTTAARLVQVWPRRFLTRAAALPYVGKPEALAEHVYGGRMGNDAPGDGWRYRGRGLLQLTGRDAYALIGTDVGVDLVAHPEQVVSAEHALAVAVALWKWKRCDAPADADDIVKVTRLINGGTTGLSDRREWLAKAKAVLAEVPA